MNLEHAVEMAKECLGSCLDVRKNNNEEIPREVIHQKLRVK